MNLQEQYISRKYLQIF